MLDEDGKDRTPKALLPALAQPGLRPLASLLSEACGSVAAPAGRSLNRTSSFASRAGSVSGGAQMPRPSEGFGGWGGLLTEALATPRVGCGQDYL